MNIKNYKKFLLKKGYVLDGPICRTIIEPLEEFLEGNPVPSLDDLFKEFSYSNKEQGIFGYNEFLKSKLQNGVETNKEQPKKNCDCANQSKIGCNNDCNY